MCRDHMYFCVPDLVYFQLTGRFHIYRVAPVYRLLENYVLQHVGRIKTGFDVLRRVITLL